MISQYEYTGDYSVGAILGYFLLILMETPRLFLGGQNWIFCKIAQSLVLSICPQLTVILPKECLLEHKALVMPLRVNYPLKFSIFFFDKRTSYQLFLQFFSFLFVYLSRMIIIILSTFTPAIVSVGNIFASQVGHRLNRHFDSYVRDIITRTFDFQLHKHINNSD